MAGAGRLGHPWFEKRGAWKSVLFVRSQPDAVSDLCPNLALWAKIASFLFLDRAILGLPGVPKLRTSAEDILAPP